MLNGQNSKSKPSPDAKHTQFQPKVAWACDRQARTRSSRTIPSLSKGARSMSFPSWPNTPTHPTKNTEKPHTWEIWRGEKANMREIEENQTSIRLFKKSSCIQNWVFFFFFYHYKTWKTEKYQKQQNCSRGVTVKALVQCTTQATPNAKNKPRHYIFVPTFGHCNIINSS